MKRLYYFIQSDTDATDAALYIVRVGRSNPEQRALDKTSRRARTLENLLPSARFRHLAVCLKVAGAKQAPRPARRFSFRDSLNLEKSC